MRDALNATGRPILFSMCEWGINNPGAWAPEVANSWRTTPDIRDEWTSLEEIVEINARRWRYAKPGSFNDPDMLEIGNGACVREGVCVCVRVYIFVAVTENEALLHYFPLLFLTLSTLTQTHSYTQKQEA